jgi:hypothetical protein
MTLGAPIDGDLLAGLHGDPRLGARGCAAKQIEAVRTAAALIAGLKFIAKKLR